MANDQERRALIDRIVEEEWRQFQDTTNEGGRASCQGNKPMFTVMRLSQFATWPDALLASWLDDLQAADRAGRNLVTEKYARMMASTVPEEYHRSIEPHLEPIGQARSAQQERIIARQVAWARDFMARWPRLGAGMRVLSTAQDTPESTSFETYLRGELSTYSQATLDAYGQFVESLAAQGRNLTEDTVGTTVRLSGFASLEEAERAQA